LGSEERTRGLKARHKYALEARPQSTSKNHNGALIPMTLEPNAPTRTLPRRSL
jgi:hypothetical protein